LILWCILLTDKFSTNTEPELRFSSQFHICLYSRTHTHIYIGKLNSNQIKISPFSYISLGWWCSKDEKYAEVSFSLLMTKKMWCHYLYRLQRNCQESSFSPHRHKEKEEKLIKPKGEEEYNALSWVHISRKLLPLCVQSWGSSLPQNLLHGYVLYYIYTNLHA